jgi:hypothetical protein
MSAYDAGLLICASALSPLLCRCRPERMLTPEGLKPGWLMPFGHAPRWGGGQQQCTVTLLLLAICAVHMEHVCYARVAALPLCSGRDLSHDVRSLRCARPALAREALSLLNACVADDLSTVQS